MLNLVLYQPDIPQNLGAILRLSACLGATVHIVEPCGFPLDAARLRRAGMDYIDKTNWIRHLNWQAFLEYRKKVDAGRVAEGEPPRTRVGHGGRPPSRLLLLETDGSTAYTDFAYHPSDYVVLGSEGNGTPRALYAQMDETLVIPMREGLRSLNVAMSAGLITAEACRQFGWNFQQRHCEQSEAIQSL